VRVVGGELGGRVLQAPPGRTTRPTSDLVRGALFDALVARCGGLSGRRALDLFAGSGALGIEALSRGCAQVWFVERARAALAVLRANLASLQLQARTAVLSEDVWRALAGSVLPGQRFDLLLADPPYAEGCIRLVAAAGEAAWLSPEALCAFEHAAREELPARSGTLRRVWYRAYGGSAVSVYAPDRAT
jgi:16S rRNA (guanine966-N2)-methyltransferase